MDTFPILNCAINLFFLLYWDSGTEKQLPVLVKKAVLWYTYLDYKR